MHACIQRQHRAIPPSPSPENNTFKYRTALSKPGVSLLSWLLSGCCCCRSLAGRSRACARVMEPMAELIEAAAEAESACGYRHRRISTVGCKGGQAAVPLRCSTPPWRLRLEPSTIGREPASMLKTSVPSSFAADDDAMPPLANELGPEALIGCVRPRTAGDSAPRSYHSAHRTREREN